MPVRCTPKRSPYRSRCCGCALLEVGGPESSPGPVGDRDWLHPVHPLTNLSPGASLTHDAYELAQPRAAPPLGREQQPHA
jgi:hypothetical protein